MIVDVRLRGRDGKAYPEHLPTREERIRFVRLVHELHCGKARMSIRAIARALPEHGFHRSRSAVALDLNQFWCNVCGPR